MGTDTSALSPSPISWLAIVHLSDPLVDSLSPPPCSSPSLSEWLEHFESLLPSHQLLHRKYDLASSRTIKLVLDLDDRKPGETFKLPVSCYFNGELFGFVVSISQDGKLNLDELTFAHLRHPATGAEIKFAHAYAATVTSSLCPGKKPIPLSYLQEPYSGDDLSDLQEQLFKGATLEAGKKEKITLTFVFSLNASDTKHIAPLIKRLDGLS